MLVTDECFCLPVARDPRNWFGFPASLSKGVVFHVVFHMLDKIAACLAHAGFPWPSKIFQKKHVRRKASKKLYVYSLVHFPGTSDKRLLYSRTLTV